MSGYNVCVIGGGPGGYVAAIRAAQLGLKVCLVEREHLGGICLNWGCIPTKALLKSAEVYKTIKEASSYGLSVDEKAVKFNIADVVKRSRDVSQKLSSGIKGLMKKHKIEVVEGEAKFESSSQIDVKGQKITADYFIIATGARARIIKDFEADGKLVLTYKEAMVQSELPKKLLVVGSGAIGIEFASFFNTFGSSVTVLEMQDRILPTEDAEICKLAEKSFKAQGLNILTSAGLVKFVKNSNSVSVTYKTSAGEVKTEDFDKIIMATGVVPNSDALGLEKTKVKKDEKGIILTNKHLETEDAKILAIGDVTKGPWLAHKASHEGIIASEVIAAKLGKYDIKKVHPIHPLNIPGCIYTSPQIASVGLSEAKAKELGYDVKIGRFPYMANGKAIAIGKTDGLVKTIFDKKTGELLGAHLFGADVTEFISTFLIAKTMEGTELDFIQTIFPHPTLSEMIHESVLDSESRVVHI